MDDRKSMGISKKDVIIPVAPPLTEMPEQYTDLRDSKISKIKNTRVKLVIQAQAGMIEHYWDIGNEILRRQQAEGWGAKVIDRLAKDISDEFPDVSGYSPRNLKYMRKFADTWTDPQFVQRTIAQIPWRTNILLLDKLKDADSRLWYAVQAAQNGWSRDVLDTMIASRLIERQGKAVNNFDIALPSPDSDFARDVFKDPYLFDYIGTGGERREREVEQALTDHIEKFLLELGQGFAFVGRQVRLEVGNTEYILDLLFYHLKLRCYVVIELKACEFEAGFIGQLNLYKNVVNDILRHPDDTPTIGLLLLLRTTNLAMPDLCFCRDTSSSKALRAASTRRLCFPRFTTKSLRHSLQDLSCGAIVKGKDKAVVEYSLAGFQNPIGVADWREQLTKEIPDDLRSSLPTVEEIERELETDTPQDDKTV